MPADTPLKRARRQLGWSAPTVLRKLAQLAAVRGVDLPQADSLKTELSRWENGRHTVGREDYRRLFCELYGRSATELGFTQDEDLDEDTEELRARLLVARHADAQAAELFRAQIDGARRADRRFGALTQLTVVRAQMDEIERLLRFGAPAAPRAALARALVEAGTLAGWQALDRVALRSAWDLHERAILAAREAGSVPLLAHAIAQQAILLVDLGEVDAAVEQVREARVLAGASAPAVVGAWLAAAEGEVRAAAGDRDGALGAFDDAGDLAPVGLRDAEFPFVFLDDGHLRRWRGQALAVLGDPVAVPELEDGLRRLPADFVRGRAATLVDLAFSAAAAGDRDLAVACARDARRLAGQVASDRQLRRLRRLRLPGRSDGSSNGGSIPKQTRLVGRQALNLRSGSVRGTRRRAPLTRRIRGCGRVDFGAPSSGVQSMDSAWDRSRRVPLRGLLTNCQPSPDCPCIEPWSPASRRQETRIEVERRGSAPSSKISSDARDGRSHSSI